MAPKAPHPPSLAKWLDRLYRAILLDSLKLVSITGIDFDARSHGCREGDTFDVLTLRACRAGFMHRFHQRREVLIQLVGIKRDLTSRRPTRTRLHHGG